MSLEQGYLDKAKQAIARKDMKEALLWTDKCLRIHPGNVRAATLAGRALEGENLDQAIATLRRAIDSNVEAGDKLVLYSELMQYLERAARLSRGLPPYHILNMEEFPFHFCEAEMEVVRRIWQGLRPNDPAIRSVGPAVEFLLGNLPAADAILQQIAQTAANKRVPGGYATVRYAREFYARLDQVELGGLPQVHLLKPAQFSTQNVLYIGCDLSYFHTYTVPLLRSLATHAPAADAHVHLMVVEGQPQPQFPNLDVNLCITYEVIHKGLDSPMYYHAMRLIRLYQFLQDQTLWMVDADTLVNSNPAALYAKLRGALGMRVYPGRIQPWNQFSARVVAATPDSKNYFRLVAAYLAHFMFEGNFTWGMDQMALFGAYQHMENKPALTLWGPDEFGHDTFKDDAVFLFTAGAQKKEYIAGTLAPPPSEAKYWSLFRKYTSS